MTTLVTPDTARRTDIIQYLRHYFYEHGHYPTQRELAYHFDIYQNAIKGHLIRLEKQGWIEGVAMGSSERNRFQLVNRWTSLKPIFNGIYWFQGNIIELALVDSGICSSLTNHRKPVKVDNISEEYLWSLRPITAAPTN